MNNNFKDKVLSAADALNISLTEEKLEKLYKYYSMVTEKNKVMNLTAVTDEDEFIIKHIADSMAIVKAGNRIDKILSSENSKVIDVGTGAGMPGIIVKILYPKAHMVLFDSLKKRLDFLDEVIGELSLENTETLHGRAEDIGRDKRYRESFDLVISRAVANMSTLSEYCIPLLKKGAVFLPFKSGEIDDELKEGAAAIELLGGINREVIRFDLPGTDIRRSLIIIEKNKNTPSKYPRKAGTPSKEPLRFKGGK